MRIKSVLLTATLALASMTVAGAKSAKSYDVVISSTAKIANQQLKAGEYKMKLDGANAVFTDLDNGHTYTVPAKVQSGAKKFDVTAVGSQKTGDTEQIDSIELGGTTTTVAFD
jgi:hypothetical protein